MTSVSRSSTSETVQANAPKTGARGLSGTARRSARVGVGVACAALAASAFAAGSASASSKLTETFASTGAEQSFIVPAGVTSVRVRAVGGAGETAFSGGPFQAGAPGGAGAVVAGALPVTPGEVLYLEVAANGFNGGGFSGFGGGSGGGASDVRTVSSASEGTLESRLLVAAGGGGGGGTFQEGSGGRGGDAGAPGADGLSTESGPGNTARSAGGAAGTLTGGGAGGGRCDAPAPWSGNAGTLGSGGFGGEDFGAPETGGGGGGGGYWGGGGGEGSCPFGGPFGNGGGGGGGGSSFVYEEATSASFGLASLSTAPSVSITYATPSTATPDSSTITFPGTQPLSTVSGPQTITLTNSGGNPLVISAETFAGSTPVLSSDHPEDFMIDSSSCLGAIAFEGSCQLKVRFAPQGTGTRTATLQIAGNMGAGATAIALTGTGGTLPQGPQGEVGATGSQGPQGETGATGATGQQGSQGETGATGLAGEKGQTGATGSQGLQGEVGATGSQGPAGEPGKPGATGPQGAQGSAGPKGERGPRGLTARYVCHPRQRHGKYKVACFVSVSSASKSAVKATLERKGVAYASGAVNGSTTAAGLLLKASRRVPVGRYTLVLTSKHATSRETVTVG
ncbi:MAG: choice-of-anchor D domain-containing protein [Solirubrobacteraceae bacterium]